MHTGDIIGPLGLRVGQTAEREKTVTDADLRAYADITGDENPLHFDDVFAAGTRFGRRVAQGGIAAGLFNALVAMDLPGPGTVFMSQTLSYHAPVYVNDTVTARVEVMSLKADKPVCQIKFEVRNSEGVVVLDGEGWTYTMRPEPSA
jgi:acyl dehydratase